MKLENKHWRSRRSRRSRRRRKRMSTRHIVETRYLSVLQAMCPLLVLAGSN